jgi:hypothetical protein
MKTTKDKIRLLTFFALCQNMLDFIDGSWHGHPANKQAVKMVTKQMIRELEKTMAVLFPQNRNDDPELPDALDTFQNACTAMEAFFMLGMNIDSMDQVKKDSLNTQLNILLKSYGIDCWEKPMKELWKE